MKITPRSIVPNVFKAISLSIRRSVQARQNSRLTAKEVFTAIYRKKLWGRGLGPFCSGGGSESTPIVSAYVNAISDYCERHRLVGRIAVDLGCGDFGVGRQLRALFSRYVGVDVVPELVDHLSASESDDKTEFICLDLAQDELPRGEVAFLRQVLQHLSNAEISAILPKLAAYQVVFITEHHPSAAKLSIKNRDKTHGADIRLFSGSGVYLDAPPFAIAAKQTQLLLEVKGHGFSIDKDAGVIRTFAYMPHAL